MSELDFFYAIMYLCLLAYCYRVLIDMFRGR